MFPLLLYSSYWGVNESTRYLPYREKGFKFYTSRKYVHSDPQHPYAARFDQSDGATSSAFYDYIYGIYADEQKVMVRHLLEPLSRALRACSVLLGPRFSPAQYRIVCAIITFGA